MAPLATGTPPSRSPNTVPWRMNTAQSSGVWFQPASADSAMQPGMSPSASGVRCNNSVEAIARLEMGRLIETRTIAADPVGGPVDHGCERHARIAEKAHCLRRVGEPRLRRLFANDQRLLAEPIGKLMGEPTHRNGFRAGDIDRCRWRRRVTQTAQRQRIRVALPDDIDVAHADVHRLFVADLAGNIKQNAVAHIDRIVQTEQAAGCGVGLREILEYPFAPAGRLRIFAGAEQWRFL